MDSLNDVTSYISFLSPEYLNSINKKMTFIEADIEKVRIACCWPFPCVLFGRADSTGSVLRLTKAVAL